jgi:hypothetical protein
MNDSDLGLNVEQASTEKAMEVEKTTNRSSKYDRIGERWKEARKSGESLIIRDVEKSTVEGIRNFLYRTFEKEDVIVRSTQQETGGYTMTIRKRMDGEYLQADETDGEETGGEETADNNDNPSTPEEAQQAIDEEFFDDPISENEGSEKPSNTKEDPVSLSGGPVT